MFASQVRRIAPTLALCTLGLSACGENAPTQPETVLDPSPAALLVAAPNTWTPRAAPPFQEDFYGYSLGTAPDASGNSIVYALGGTFPERGGAGGSGVLAYNVATDTWAAGRQSRVGVFYSNGVEKVGNKLYFSGGYNEPGSLPTFENRLRAYDYAADRMIRKADLPIYGAEGVSGVIKGKLYVLPGACSGDLYPQPGYCSEEATRRFYRYDPGTNTWVALPDAPHFHRGGAAAVIDGKFYVAGGFAADFAEVTALDVYDPGTNRWRTLAPLPTGGVASGAVLQGRFHVVARPVFGGSSEIRAYSYNRATNRWKLRAAPDFLGSVTRVTLGGKFYLFMAGGNRSALYAP